MGKLIIKLLGFSCFIGLILQQYHYPSGYLSAALDNSLDMDETVTVDNHKDITGIDKYRQFPNINPDNAITKLNWIQLCIEAGKYDEALEQLKGLYGQNPDDLQYRHALIKTGFLAGKWAEAVKWADAAGLAGLSAGELFWRGLSLAELGRSKDAIFSLSSSLDKEPFNPVANFKLGELYQEAGDYEKALQYYKKAAAQEPNMTAVYYPLSQVYMVLEQFQSAYRLLLNAKNSYPWNREIEATLQQLLKEHPELIEQQKIESQKRRRVAVAPQVVPIMEGRDKIMEVRIGLAEKIRKFYLKTGDKYRLTTRSKCFRGEGQSVLCIVRNAGRIEIRDSRDQLLLAEKGNVVLAYDNPAATTVLFDVEYGQGTFWAGRQDRIYRGYFNFLSKSEGITIVNRINMEEYLYGVVPAEMEASWPQAALEAQAVAARTYAVANLKRFESRGFDLLATVASQVYNGVTAEKPTTNAAVDATRGRILVYDGKPISAFYTGNNGGYSNNCRDIWGFDLPYLQAVPDKSLAFSPETLTPYKLAEWLTSRPRTYSSHPQYSGRSSYRWTLWVSRVDIENRLKLGESLGRILSVTVTGRSDNGLVTKVSIKGTGGEHTITRDKIRTRLGGLRSNMFIVEPKMGRDGLPDYFIFYGGGWGHGVGMCQSGAAGMAADGYKCEDILKHYYQGVKIEKIY